MSVSLCMIVRDEETALPSCLQSVQAIVDELVVVDTGSVDRTVAIAREFGARVHPFEWCDDFSAARNVSLELAQGDWILVLDADEGLLPDSIPALKQVIQTKDILAVNLLRREVGAAQAPYSAVSRLFRNRPDIRFFRPYHELIDDSVAAILQREPHWRVVQLPQVAMHHTGYQPGTIAQRQKFDRARTTMQRFLSAHPEDAYICNKLGALYAETGEIEAGLELLQRGLRSPQTEPTVLYELHYHLGSVYRQLQQTTQAEHHYQAAVEQPISTAQKLGAYTNWGSLRMEQGNPSGAKVLFQAVVEAAPTFAIGQFNLGAALKALGDLNGAIAHYQQAIDLDISYADAYQNLGVALWNSGKILEALSVFKQAISLHEQQGSPEADRLRQGLRQKGFNL
ncbi:tetratricopeptide repeat protein [Leptolyngbya sp. FACHB-36]|uniref:tetratricopeptide repeat protein n=1 Tax=Leptolyngbya sp. FACHB-36 TaxID=2692808 RepID=UPI001680270E|nr:tetratricopeptide repeat protein [Leptolyngbya sp. FACHB-36]MBD2022400.1 tetratricopeptide repeat protein [Leptolyngbya sp. FACHB-36]